jgi:hypothetical protein
VRDLLGDYLDVLDPEAEALDLRRSAEDLRNRSAWDASDDVLPAGAEASHLRQRLAVDAEKSAVLEPDVRGRAGLRSAGRGAAPLVAEPYTPDAGRSGARSFVALVLAGAQAELERLGVQLVLPVLRAYYSQPELALTERVQTEERQPVEEPLLVVRN